MQNYTISQPEQQKFNRQHPVLTRKWNFWTAHLLSVSKTNNKEKNGKLVQPLVKPLWKTDSKSIWSILYNPQIPLLHILPNTHKCSPKNIQQNVHSSSNSQKLKTT